MSLLSIRWRKPTEIRDSVIRTLRPAVVTGFTDAPGSTQSATSADWIVDSRSSNKATVVASVVTTDSGDSHGGAIGRTGRRRDRTVAPPPNGLSSNFGALFLDHLSMVEATSVAQSARTMAHGAIRASRTCHSAGTPYHLCYGYACDCACVHPLPQKEGGRLM